MPIWILALTLIQSLAMYLLRTGIFESLVIIGLKKLCQHYKNPTLIELTIAVAESLGKRKLLGNLQMPEQPPVDLPAVSKPSAPSPDKGS